MDPEEFLQLFPVGKQVLKITTTDEKCHLWFNIALNLCYGFNHEQCKSSCDQASALDPEAPMPYFLAAFSLGMNYNFNPPSFPPEHQKLVFELWQKADLKAKANDQVTGLQRDLITALRERVGDGKTLEHAELDQNFAKAMKTVYQKYPNEPSVACLYAESMMNLRPWNMWSQSDTQTHKYGEPFELTEETERVLKRGLEIDEDHIGLRHLWCHFWELSKVPEKASDVNFKTQLRDLAPALGHLCHMPSHIDILTGDYQESIDNNSIGVVADDTYFQYRQENQKSLSTFYTLYRLHNAHFLAYSGCFSGNFSVALNASQKIMEIVNLELLKDTVNIQPSGAFWAEGFLPVLLHVYIRFGKWNEIIGQPFAPALSLADFDKEPELYCSTRTTISYARAIAFAVLAGLSQSQEEQEELLKKSLAEKQEFQKRLEQMDGRVIFNVTMKQSLTVGQVLMQGEILYRMEKYDEAFVNLRSAVERSDKLPYNEPWGWMIPARHALGALLLEEGIKSNQPELVKQAEQVFKEDFGLVSGIKRSVWNPNNIWSLIGLQQAYKYLKNESQLGKITEILEQKKAFSDIQISSSCMCSVKE